MKECLNYTESLSGEIHGLTRLQEYAVANGEQKPPLSKNLNKLAQRNIFRFRVSPGLRFDTDKGRMPSGHR